MLQMRIVLSSSLFLCMTHLLPEAATKVVFGSVYRTDHSNQSVFLTELINVTLQLNDVYQALVVVDDGRNTRAGHLRFDYSFPLSSEQMTLDYSIPINIDSSENNYKIVRLVTFTFNKTMPNQLVSNELIIIDVFFRYVNHISRNETSKHAKIHLLTTDSGTATTTSTPASTVSHMHTATTSSQSPCVELQAVSTPRRNGSSWSAHCGKYEWMFFGIIALTWSFIIKSL